METEEETGTGNETRKELTKISVNEHNVSVLLKIVLSIMTDEQLEELKRQLSELEAETEKNNKNNNLLSYIN